MAIPASQYRSALASLAPLAWGVALAAAAWAFWPTLRNLGLEWVNNPDYSHGVLVPVFAAYLLWLRRGRFRPEAPAAAPGFALLLAGAMLRAAGGLFIFEWFDAVSLLPTLLGITLLLGGRAAFRAAAPAILFLFFMIPLPYTIDRLLGGPLQTLASRGSTFLLQALGQPAVREGNTILLNDVRLSVVKACSGLRMLVTFFAFSTGFALLMGKPLLERCCVVLSAVPVALLTNVLRITATGVMYQRDPLFAQKFFHDLAGWFMMPLCLLFLGLELWVLDRLIIDGGPPRPAALLRLRLMNDYPVQGRT